MPHLLLIVLLLAATGASAQSVDRVLSLPFGKPLDRDIARCPTSNKQVMDYCGLTGTYKRSSKLRYTSVMLLPPPVASEFAVPSWVATDIVHVDFGPDGSITRIAVSTEGPSEQDKVIESIGARFGRPTSLSVLRKQNAFGAAVQVKRAIWQLPAIDIYHDCLELPKCVVSFSVPDQPSGSQPRKSAPATP